MASAAEPAPIIVLDIDGVLHPLRPSGHALHAKMEDLTARCDADLELSDSDETAVGGVVAGEFTEDCMTALAKLVKTSGAQIILSSTWRETAVQRRAVDQQLKKCGIPAHSGCTPKLPLVGGGRAAEILAWAKTAPAGCWVAIDDTPLVGIPERHYLQTDPAVGLTAANVERVLGMLRWQKEQRQSARPTIFKQ